MRIFYAADHEPMPGNRLWHNNLYLPLVDLGHDVIPFDYELTGHFLHADPSDPRSEAFIEENRPRLEQQLLRQITEAHRQRPVTLFFSYFYNAFCRPEVIREIRALGICTVNWYCNGSYQFHLVNEIAPAYDYCLVPEKFRLADYRRVGANPIYCQEAANPNLYKPYPLKQEYPVTFVGQKYGDRPAYIRYLWKSGIDVRAWGPGWQLQPLAQTGIGAVTRKGKRLVASVLGKDSAIVVPAEICGPALSDEDMIKMFSRSRINLGFSSCGATHKTSNRILQVRLRDFEVPMSGGFYMIEYQEELEEFFDIGREIICYHDRADLLDKIKFYLNNETEREQVRQAGYRRAVNDHTWHKRFEKVFEAIGLAS